MAIKYFKTFLKPIEFRMTMDMKLQGPYFFRGR